MFLIRSRNHSSKTTQGVRCSRSGASAVDMGHQAEPRKLLPFYSIFSLFIILNNPTTILAWYKSYVSTILTQGLTKDYKMVFL